MKKLILVFAITIFAFAAKAQKMPDSVFIKVKNIVTIGTPEEVSAEKKRRVQIVQSYSVLGYEFNKLMQNPKDKESGLYILLIYRYGKK